MQQMACKRIMTIIGLAITIVIIAVLVFFVLQSSVQANSTLNSDDTFVLGVENTVFSSQSLCYDNWILANFSPDDTYQLRFYKGGKVNSLVVNSGTWATISDNDGNKKILHLIPAHIASKGYDKVTVTPILGDGNYMVSAFSLLDSADKDHYKDCNVIDFEIKQLEIEIDKNDYAKIEKKREEAIKLGILVSDDSDYVEADVKANDNKYKVDLRLKGDWTDHLTGDQWSFRIDLKGDNCIYGLQKFSIQPLQTRHGMWEYLIYEMYRDQGGVALRYDFADVFVNGVYKGVYAVEEFMEKRVIENSQKREGPIIKISEDLLWEHWAYYMGDQAYFSFSQHNTEVFSEKKTVQSENLAGYAKYAITQLNKLVSGEAAVSDVLDIDMYARLNAILDIFSASHGRIWHNMRNYYNPVTGLMEPIPFDELGYSNPHVLADKDEYMDYFGFSTCEEYKDLYKKYLKQFIKEYPDFIARHQATIDRFVTTIERYIPGYDMDVFVVNDRINSLQTIFDDVQAPVFDLAYDENEGIYKFSIINNNILALRITDVLAPDEYSDSDMADDLGISALPLKIEGNSVYTISLPKDFDVKELSGISFVYKTVFSDNMTATFNAG